MKLTSRIQALAPQLIKAEWTFVKKINKKQQQKNPLTFLSIIQEQFFRY